MWGWKLNFAYCNSLEFFLNISHLALRILREHELYWTDDNKPIFTSLETRAEQKYDDSFYNCYVIYAMFNVYTSI